MASINNNNNNNNNNNTIVPLSHIQGKVQKYDWGMKGLKSLVAELHNLSFDGKGIIDCHTPYAELWFGTHPSGPSEIISSSSLSTSPSLSSTPLLLRNAIGHDLPYLFKILSVNKALSIQAHPDRTLATLLHLRHPDHYRDNNHKPEMTYALTPFQAMSQFRNPQQIVFFLCHVNEFYALFPELIAIEFVAAVGSKNDGRIKLALKGLFSALMNTPHDILDKQLHLLIKRLQEEKLSGKQLSKQYEAVSDDEIKSLEIDKKNGIDHLNPYDLLLRLFDEYGVDIGVFCPFVLNCIQLSPGSAIFLAPNEPHAYLYGNCVETMAGSDNVVRAGLTPKYRDVNTLCAMLTYNYGMPSLEKKNIIDNYSHYFAPPSTLFPEFKLTITTLPKGIKNYLLKAEKGYAIILGYKGIGDISIINDDKNHLIISAGKSLLLPPIHDAVINNNGEEPLILFRCSANE